MKLKSGSRLATTFFGLLCLVLLGLTLFIPGEITHSGSANLPTARSSNLELVQNGGFENDFNSWVESYSPNYPFQPEWLQISTTTVHSGSKALQVGTADTQHPGFFSVGQDVNIPYQNTEISFWFNPVGVPYALSVRMFAFNVVASDIHFQDGDVTLSMRRFDQSVGEFVDQVSASAADVITSNSWNKVVVQIDGPSRTQHLYVNDEHVLSATSLFDFPTVNLIRVGDNGGATNYGVGYFDDISVTEMIPACTFETDPVTAVEDEVLGINWISRFIFNSGLSDNIWSLDAPEFPNTGNTPPVRLDRYAYSGEANQAANVELAFMYPQSIVPPTGGLQRLQFEFDFQGDEQQVGSLILQDGSYYRGPTFDVDPGAGWTNYSSGCLSANHFLKRTGTGPGQPDLTRPFAVGYSLSGTTNLSEDTREFYIDNFRVSADGVTTLGDPPAIPNLAPIAVEDVTVVEVDGDFPHVIGVLANDIDADGDPLQVTQVTQPQFSSTHIDNLNDNRFVIYNIPDIPEEPINAPSTDNFEYTVSDGELESTSGVLVLFEYCAMGAIAAMKGAVIDLTLIRRFRDEVMKPTEYGANIVDHYYEKTPALLKTIIVDRPELAKRAHSMVELLQPALSDVLDGDGTLPITQAQMDTVAAFFADLSAAGNVSVQQLIADEMDRLGPLDAYVGRPVSEVLDTVLGETIDTDVERDTPSPADFTLEPNYPNPFQTSTRIQYTLSQPASISLTIYDLQGRRIRTLVVGQQESGMQSVTWDGLGDQGVSVPSGVYFVRLTAPGQEQTQKLVLRK